MTGRRITHYEILEEIGHGGMGVVYKARDTHLDRFVAIKVLPPEKVTNPERKRRFVQEAKAASALNHPNIVTIFDIYSDNGTDFIAMEYVPGKGLDELIPRKGMPLAELLKIAVQVADALTAAHAAGIVHRDLKPANIIVGDDARVRVLDFGLAKLTDPSESSELDETKTVAVAESSPHTEEGTILGTAAYMSPEQAEGRKVDARSDIFSFGSVLYEMVTGRRPFRGESNMAILAAIINKEPEELPDDVPRDLRKLIRRCMRKDPDRRFNVMKDLRVELEELKEESDSGTLNTEPRVAKSPPRTLLRWMWPVATLLAFIVTAWLVMDKTGEDVGQADLVPVPLTSYPGLEYNPSFSPDGDRVAFSWCQNGDCNIYVKLIGSESRQQLTDSGRDTQPAWSPDGREIAFLRETDATSYSLVVIPSLGGSERVLADIPATWRYFGLLHAWHPSGDWLAVRSQADSEAQAGLTLVSTRTGERRALPTGGNAACPAFSPDGGSLVFCRFRSDSQQLWLLSLTDDVHPQGDQRQLTDGRCRSPAWLPNSQEIIYASNREGGWGLWRLRVTDGAQPTRLAFAGQDVESVALSPAGDRLALVRLRQNADIWRVSLSEPGIPRGSSEKIITSTFQDRQARYSPDGEHIAFVSFRTGKSELWVCDSDGSNPVQLTSFSGSFIDAPGLSPDGTLIAFRGDPADGRSELFSIGVNGGALKRLTEHAAHDGGEANWSADGQWIYFNSNRTGREACWKIPAVGGEAIQVTTEGTGSCREGPDGQYIYFGQYGYQPPDDPESKGYHVMRMPVRGGERERLVGPLNHVHVFDVANDGIYFIPRPDSNERLSIRFHDFISGSTKTVVNLEADLAIRPSASPDGRHLIWTEFQATSDLMLVENFR